MLTNKKKRLDILKAFVSTQKNNILFRSENKFDYFTLQGDKLKFEFKLERNSDKLFFYIKNFEIKHEQIEIFDQALLNTLKTVRAERMSEETEEQLANLKIFDMDEK